MNTLARRLRRTLALSLVALATAPTVAHAAPITVCVGAVPAAYGCDNTASNIDLAGALVEANAGTDQIYLAPGTHATTGVTFTQPVRIAGTGDDRGDVTISGTPADGDHGLVHFTALPSTLRNLTVQTTGPGNVARVETPGIVAETLSVSDVALTAPLVGVWSALTSNAPVRIEGSSLQGGTGLSLHDWGVTPSVVRGTLVQADDVAFNLTADTAGRSDLEIDRVTATYGGIAVRLRQGRIGWAGSETGSAVHVRVHNTLLRRYGTVGGYAFMLWDEVDGAAHDLRIEQRLELDHVTLAGTHQDLFHLLQQPYGGPGYTDMTSDSERRIDVRMRGTFVHGTATRTVRATCYPYQEDVRFSLHVDGSAFDDSSALREANAECTGMFTYAGTNVISPAGAAVVDAAGGVFRPTADSTLVDAAGCVTGGSSDGFDLLGGLRRVDGPANVDCDPAADIGAYEYQRSAPTVDVTQMPNAPVLTGSQVTLTATAVDPDPGETAGLTNGWTLPGGATSPGLNATFAAPATAGTYAATFTSTDATGAARTAVVNLYVVEPTKTIETIVEKPVEKVVVRPDTTVPSLGVQLMATSGVALRAGTPLRARVTTNEPSLVTCTPTVRIRMGRSKTRMIRLGTSSAPAWTGTGTIAFAPTRPGLRAVRAALAVRGATLVGVSAACTAVDAAGNSTARFAAAKLRGIRTLTRR